MFSLFMPAKQTLVNNRLWISISFYLFLLFALGFYFFTPVAEEQAGQLLDPQMEQLAEIMFLLLESNKLIGTLFIFMNNFMAMVQMLLLGAAAGLSPLITLVLNGALIGYISSLSAAEGLPVLNMIIFGILPHGIFELPAFFLCGGLGLKLGFHCVFFPLPGKNRLESFKYIWKEAISLLPLVVILLLAAAFIEIFITPGLLERFL